MVLHLSPVVKCPRCLFASADDDDPLAKQGLFRPSQIGLGEADSAHHASSNNDGHYCRQDDHHDPEY